MPSDTYLIRLIHHGTHKPLPGERLWPAAQLLRETTLRFLRVRNREGFDVYFRPYAANHNAGYILIDLDEPQPSVLARMRDQGHEPCTVVETSPGRLQAWIRVSVVPLPPPIATLIGRHLARLYQGDRASADWRHVGRLAGFTNQKPHRRLPSGWPPWVQLQRAVAGLASNSSVLVETATLEWTQAGTLPRVSPPRCALPRAVSGSEPSTSRAILPAEAAVVYQTWLNRLGIRRRFPQPDWSIADLWIAKALFAQGEPAARVRSILRLASPQFPRGHSDPEDYLRRTLTRALRDLSNASFPARNTDPHALG